MVQFLQVGRLDQALILLGLDLCVPSISVSSMFMVLYITFFRCILFCLFSDKTEWRLISATLCGWRRCFMTDQLWLMTCIREEEEWWDWWDLPLSAWDVKPYYTYHTYQRWSIILGVSTMDDVMWEKYAPKTPPKVAWVANFKTSKHMSQYLQKYYSDQL